MIKTTFLVLNLILLIGLFFEGNTVGLYLCTFAPFLYLVARNKGKLQVNIAIVIVIIFITNIIIQIFFGYPPDVKLVLNFVGNLVMVYAIISLLDSKNKLGDYLESLFKLQIILSILDQRHLAEILMKLIRRYANLRNFLKQHPYVRLILRKQFLKNGLKKIMIFLNL